MKLVIGVLAAVVTTQGACMLVGGKGTGGGGGGFGPQQQRIIDGYFTDRQRQIAEGTMPDPRMDPLIIGTPALAQRLAAMDKTWAQKLGPTAQAAAADGTRVTNVGEDVKAAVAELQPPRLNGNPKNLSDVNDSDIRDFQRDYAAFEKRLDNLLKKAPEGLRYYDRERRVDELTVVLGSMNEHAKIEGGLADHYVPEPEAPKQSEHGCGVIHYTLESEKVGGQWAQWDVGPDSFNAFGDLVTEHVDCKAFPKDDADSPALLRELKAAFTDEPGKYKLVQRTKIQMYNRDEGIHRHALRGVRADVYGEIDLDKNPCGAQKTFCEKGGSKAARAANEAAFYLKRAEDHKAAHELDACAKSITKANDVLKEWDAAYKEFVDSGSWTPGGKYKLRDNRTISEKELFDRFKEMKATAEDRKLGYCK